MLALETLHKYWGFDNFRARQEEIINSTLDGRDTVALLPTGGGKSICFQVPGLMQDGICLVISPLVALMTDQVAALKEKGIKAMKIVGGISSNKLTEQLDNAIYGNYKFLYLSPERLQQEQVQSAIKKMSINLIAVDEAHCISQWGNDFRPAYKNIKIVREIHPLIPIIALTATATPEVLEDTIEQLRLEHANIFRSSFRRENLAYRTIFSEDKIFKLESAIKDSAGSVIVYVRSRKAAVETSNKIISLGISSTFYHGGITASEKRDRLDSWMQNKLQVMVATSAFGMGIDHPNVRLVIHINIPESLESYFQEAGRAGRDGLPAQAIMFYNNNDKRLVQKQFIASQPSVKDIKAIYRKLSSYFQIPYGEGEFTEHDFEFYDFCTTYDLNTIQTFQGLNYLDRLGVIQLSKQFGRKSILQFLASTETLLDYFVKDQKISLIGKTILRLYGGIFEGPTQINLNLIAKKTGQSEEVVVTVLKGLEDKQYASLKLFTTDATLTFLRPREDEKTINPLAKEIVLRNEKKTLQVRSVLSYIENNDVCKSIQLVTYFGEESAVSCGICSVCAASEKIPSKKETRQIAEEILILLENDTRTSREICKNLTFTEEKIVHVLRRMLDSGRISLNTKNEYGLR